MEQQGEEGDMQVQPPGLETRCAPVPPVTPRCVQTRNRRVSAARRGSGRLQSSMAPGLAVAGLFFHL